jgi:exonuclease SbcC
LSAGTYDQLYLTIRLGLGEQLLKGNKGFFIMDDPFVKSDMDRLKKQIKLLKKISKTGWQIIYFTAKEEVKELFERDIKNNKISFFQLPGIQF